MERSKISYINSGKLITILFFLFACQSKESTPSLPGSAKPFSLPQVELLDGPFKHATELNIESLLQ
ncbi:MAG: hypothetical protein KDD99_19920, partial [Bacteroidetes bacterium]|nr:hypothetical protein [Bacteroidota bacterium]